jgi:hypothetical protein
MHIEIDDELRICLENSNLDFLLRDTYANEPKNYVKLLLNQFDDISKPFIFIYFLNYLDNINPSVDPHFKYFCEIYLDEDTRELFDTSILSTDEINGWLDESCVAYIKSEYGDINIRALNIIEMIFGESKIELFNEWLFDKYNEIRFNYRNIN